MYLLDLTVDCLRLRGVGVEAALRSGPPDLEQREEDVHRVDDDALHGGGAVQHEGQQGLDSVHGLCRGQQRVGELLSRRRDQLRVPAAPDDLDQQLTRVVVLL